MGFLQLGFGASQVLGIPISLFIANAYGWQSPFLMIVVLAIIIWFVILFKIKPIDEHLKVRAERRALVHLWKTLATRNYRIGFLATALWSLGGFMMMPWGSAFAINNLKVTEQQLPFLFMRAGLASLVIMPVIGKMSDRYDKFRIFAVASIWMMAMVIIYTNLTPIPFWIIVVLNILFMAGIMSRMVPAMALTTALPELSDRGAFMSINSSLQQIAGGFAAAIGGMIVVQKDNFAPLEHYDTMGYVIVVISIAGIYTLSRVSALIKNKQSGREKQKAADIEPELV
jgi:predicted MFS family arabinose efflux permease